MAYNDQENRVVTDNSAGCDSLQKDTDTHSLKSGAPQGAYGFDPRPGHSNQSDTKPTQNAAPSNVVKRSKRTYQKGDKVSYFAFHARVRTARGKPQHCEQCKTSDPTKFYDWANLTGKYEDVSDYIRLCRRCHVRKDGTWRNIPCLQDAELRQEVLP